VRAEPLENLLNRAIKRCFDIVFSVFIILFVFSWLFPILAILIKLESRGPVFFTQVRSGHNNNPFKCYKFRSMYVNGDADKRQATRNDSRVTKIGAFIRRTSLDELPQFFNVLIGNMSVVGPRPHMLNHTQEYSELIDMFMVRHFLKPGITGQAQVKGFRGETKTVEDMNQRVEADLWYLENWSFLLDLKIIFLTVRNSLVGEENAF
jgi:exopolysaccharide biosynthesis polyprenyl glycosylphosphotransferase